MGVNLIEVSDASDDRLRDYAGLTDAQLRAADFAGERGAFIAEGELVVRQLIGSRFPIRSILVSRERLPGLGELLGRLPERTPVFAAPGPVLEAIVGFPFHRGVLASGQRVPDPPLVGMLREAKALVILEDLANHDNVGAVFRNVGALGGPGAAVLLSPGCCDPLYRKSLRVSIGQALCVPYTRIAPWPAALAEVAGAGFTILALTPGVGARDYRKLGAGAVERPAFLLGTEGRGLSAAAFEQASIRVRIPMRAGVDSLNIATAAAIVMSQLMDPQAP